MRTVRGVWGSQRVRRGKPQQGPVAGQVQRRQGPIEVACREGKKALRRHWPTRMLTVTPAAPALPLPAAPRASGSLPLAGHDFHGHHCPRIGVHAALDVETALQRLADKRLLVPLQPEQLGLQLCKARTLVGL